MEYEITKSTPLCLGEFNTKGAILAAVPDAENGLAVGTLLSVDENGKLTAYTSGENYPVCVNLNEVDKSALADDSEIQVVYWSRINKDVVEAANPDVEMTDALLWELLKNGLDVYKMK